MLVLGLSAVHGLSAGRMSLSVLLARALQWIEAMLIALGNRVSTIEYNVPTTDHPMLECKSYADWFEPGDSNGNTSHGR